MLDMIPTINVPEQQKVSLQITGSRAPDSCTGRTADLTHRAFPLKTRRSPCQVSHGRTWRGPSRKHKNQPRKDTEGHGKVRRARCSFFFRVLPCSSVARHFL